MKIRTGFISNSSSSSFMIKMDDLNPLQVFLIKNHYDFCKIMKEFSSLPEDWKWIFEDGFTDPWDVEEVELDGKYGPKDGEYISGFTWMDNFDMRFFLEEVLHVDPDDIEWGQG